MVALSLSLYDASAWTPDRYESGMFEIRSMHANIRICKIFGGRQDASIRLCAVKRKTLSCNATASASRYIKIEISCFRFLIRAERVNRAFDESLTSPGPWHAMPLARDVQMLAAEEEF